MHTVRAIAVLIASPLDSSRLLTVRRPDDDEDLPGVGGLAATSLKDDESVEAAARKLGANVTLGAMLAEGSQESAAQHFSLSLYAATLDATSPELPESNGQIDGSTYYTDWQWDLRESLSQGAQMGSLCCQLALQDNSTESM